MNEKTRDALRTLRDDVAIDDAFGFEGPGIEVDKDDLKRVLRWVQNHAHAWFIGDRVKRTGASVPYDFITEDIRGTVVEDSGENGIAMVEWDGAPVQYDRVKMFHNEIKLAKD